jgi:mevalonate kinase
MQKNYQSKILLFGEYAILSGGAALAVPVSNFLGHWAESPIQQSSESNRSRKSLWQLLSYIQTQPDLRDLCNSYQLNKDLDAGLYFAANIPEGYGVGSSGAVVAAVFDTYFQPIADIAQLRQILAAMESCFHGSSSGLDPLVCYTNSPILIQDGQPTRLAAQPFPITSFLIDTHLRRNTSPLVQQYRKLCENADFENELATFRAANLVAIEAWQKNDVLNLRRTIREISIWQWANFRFMIPEAVANLWQKGISTGLFSLKLCGAGGGGFMLAFANSDDFEAETHFAGYDFLQLDK